MNYSKVKNRKLGEVISEQQYASLRENIFLSLLQEVLSSSTDDKAENNSITEKRELLNIVFDMSNQEITQRIEDFLSYQHNK